MYIFWVDYVRLPNKNNLLIEKIDACNSIDKL